MRRTPKPGDVNVTIAVRDRSVFIEWKIPRGHTDADALRVLRAGLFEMLDALDRFQKGPSTDAKPD